MAVPRSDFLSVDHELENGPLGLFPSDNRARVKIFNAGGAFCLAVATTDVDNIAYATRTVLLPLMYHIWRETPPVQLHVVHFDAYSWARCEYVPIHVVDESWVHS